MIEGSTGFVVAIVFLATLVRSAFGFGEALIAVPLLALFIPVTIAAPVAVLMSVTVAAVIIAQDWRHIHVRSVGWLVGATLFGIPFGLALLVRVDEHWVKALLAFVIIGFSAFCLVRRHRPRLKEDRPGWVLSFGFLAGVLGGAYGMNGPPLVIYAVLRGWSPEQIRATLQGYFFPASLVGLAGYWWQGLWTPVVTRCYLWSLPAAIAAIFLGRFVHRRLRGPVFLIYVHLGLLVVGVILLTQALLK